MIRTGPVHPGPGTSRPPQHQPRRRCTVVSRVDRVRATPLTSRGNSPFGMAVAVAPRLGAWLVAAWLAGIIVNLLTFPGFFDIALRDFGLFVAAVALARLATGYAPGWRTS